MKNIAKNQKVHSMGDPKHQGANSKAGTCHQVLHQGPIGMTNTLITTPKCTLVSKRPK